jgi:hypothetical protein
MTTDDDRTSSVILSKAILLQLQRADPTGDRA